MIRLILVILGGLGLSLLAFGELGLAYPVAGWLYLVGLAVFAAGLIRPGPLRSQRPRLAVLSVGIVAVAALYFVEWTTRKPFLRDLAKVQSGMTEAEVRRIMGRYQEGTGWPAPPARGSAQMAAGKEVGGQESHTTPEPSSRRGELTMPNSLVFRHSNTAKFNSDWGIVSFSGGRVVGVRFDAD